LFIEYGVQISYTYTQVDTAILAWDNVICNVVLVAAAGVIIIIVITVIIRLFDSRSQMSIRAYVRTYVRPQKFSLNSMKSGM